MFPNNWETWTTKGLNQEKDVFAESDKEKLPKQGENKNNGQVQIKFETHFGVGEMPDDTGGDTEKEIEGSNVAGVAERDCQSGVLIDKKIWEPEQHIKNMSDNN